MLKERALLKSLYTMMFYIENIQIILLDADQLKNLDYSAICDKETKKVCLNIDLFSNNYKELKYYLNKIEKIDIVGFEEILASSKNNIVNFYDYSKDEKLTLELRDILEKIMNSKETDLNILILNKNLIEKFKYMFKTIYIDLNSSDQEIIESFIENNKHQIKVKEELHYRIEEKMNDQNVIKNLKNFLNNLKNSKAKLDFVNEDDISDFDYDYDLDKIDLNSEEAIRELNERFDILNIMVSKERFENIIGLKQVKEKLHNLVKLYKEDIKDLNKYGIERDKGFILYGEPGTGKTMLCKAFANELDGIFVYLSMEQFMTKKNDSVNLNSLFEEIDELSFMYPEKTIVLFLDEFDSLRSRGSSEHNNSFYDGFTNEMLYRVDNLPKNVMIIGATNKLNSIDDAIKRKGRLGNQYEVKNNFKKEEIISFIESNFKKSKMSTLNKYSNEIATMIYFMNGSEISNILNKIKQSYFFKNKYKDKIKLKELIINTIYSEKYNLADYEVKADEELSTAYHEAGHAIMYMVHYGSKDLHEISIYPTAKTLGFVSYKFDKQEVTKDDLKKLVLISLAGRYGEKLITNNISTGAIADLETANKHIESIISKYGMGDVENINTSKKSVSEYMMAKMDKEHEALLKEYSKEAEEIIKLNKNVIESIAKDLILNKVIIDDFKKYENLIIRKI